MTKIASLHSYPDAGEVVFKIVVSPGRIHWITGSELYTWSTTTGTRSLHLTGSNSMADVTVSGDRVYTLEGGGYITWRRPTSLEATIVTAFASGAATLHVDSEDLYYASAGVESGVIARYGRDYESSGGQSDFPKVLFTGPIRAFTGMGRHLYALAGSDESGTQLVRADKPAHGDRIVALGSWSGVNGAWLDVDENGLVAHLQQGTRDLGRLVSMGTDGTNEKTIASGNIQHVTMNASHAYFITDYQQVHRVARDGVGGASLLMKTSCRFTAVAAGSDAVYFATVRKKTVEVWRMKL